MPYSLSQCFHLFKIIINYYTSYDENGIDFNIENNRLFYLNMYNISEKKFSFILLLNAYFVHINNEVFNFKASYDDE